MHRLFFTADDFGLTDGVCTGIVEARRSGVLARTSAMACVPGSLDRVRLWAPQFPGPIGAHLQLTDGHPCADPSRVPTLVDQQGAFRGRKSTPPESFNPREVAVEWRAQIEALRGAGIAVTHIDTHHHLHRHEEISGIYLDLAREYNLAARTGPGKSRALRKAGIQCADYCETRFFSEDPSIESLLHLVLLAKSKVPAGGLIEVVCHPGRASPELEARSTYVAQREKELEILTRPDLRGRLSRVSIELVDGE